MINILGRSRLERGRSHFSFGSYGTKVLRSMLRDTRFARSLMPIVVFAIWGKKSRCFTDFGPVFLPPGFGTGLPLSSTRCEHDALILGCGRPLRCKLWFSWRDCLLILWSWMRFRFFPKEPVWAVSGQCGFKGTTKSLPIKPGLTTWSLLTSGRLWLNMANLPGARSWSGVRSSPWRPMGWSENLTVPRWPMVCWVGEVVIKSIGDWPGLLWFPLQWSFLHLF